MKTSQKITVVAAGLLSAALFGAEAPAQTVVGQAGEACATTMGLNPANADYDMCVTSSRQTMARVNQAAQVDRDRRACVQRGLQADTREFALYVVDAEQAAASASPSASTAQLAQERHACAELSIAPGSGAFDQCVADLDMTMFEANNTTAR